MNPVWSVRVRAEARRAYVGHARNHSVRLGPALSFEPNDALPSALETFLCALGGDLCDTLLAYARRMRIEVDDVEISLVVRLENALANLGVVGEIGSPCIQSIEGAIYISSDAPPDRVEYLWSEALLRSPLYQTLKDAVIIQIRLNQTV